MSSYKYILLRLVIKLCPYYYIVLDLLSYCVFCETDFVFGLALMEIPLFWYTLNQLYNCTITYTHVLKL